MPPKVFFINEKTGKRFEVVSRDQAKGTIVLRGSFGDFTETYSKERFKELGYKLVQEDSVPPAEPTVEEEPDA